MGQLMESQNNGGERVWPVLPPLCCSGYQKGPEASCTAKVRVKMLWPVVSLYRGLAESKIMLWPRGGVEHKHLLLNV